MLRLPQRSIGSQPGFEDLSSYVLLEGIQQKQAANID